MSDDALERLKKRQRPSVRSRDASLQDKSIGTSIARYQESKKPVNQDSEVSGAQTEELKTKQSTIRLEAGLGQRLQEVCRRNGLSREVLIEALFSHYESDPETQQVVLAEAKQRAEHRQQIANYRRAQSMMLQFGREGVKGV